MMHIFHDFIAGQAVARIGKPVATEARLRQLKAGFIPFRLAPCPDNATYTLAFYLIRPASKRPKLAPPPLQIAKGTRLIRKRKSGEWRDMKKNEIFEQDIEKEALLVTALREAVEEAGLVMANVARLFECGIGVYASASTGKPLEMMLFAGEMTAPEHFLDDEALGAAIAERRWVRLPDDIPEIRDDHAKILAYISQELQRYYRTRGQEIVV